MRLRVGDYRVIYVIEDDEVARRAARAALYVYLSQICSRLVASWRTVASLWSRILLIASS